jgi:hypothetical protein
VRIGEYGRRFFDFPDDYIRIKAAGSGKGLYPARWMAPESLADASVWTAEVCVVLLRCLLCPFVARLLCGCLHAHSRVGQARSFDTIVLLVASRANPTSLPCTRTRTHAAQPLVAQTDVWSWGVTAWEIASLGLRPYGDVADADVVKHVAATGKDASTRLPTARLDIAEVRAALSLRACGLLSFCLASFLSCTLCTH